MKFFLGKGNKIRVFMCLERVYTGCILIDFDNLIQKSYIKILNEIDLKLLYC